MRTLTGLVLAGGLLAAPFAAAQPPGGGKKDKGPKAGDAPDPTARMMLFDTNEDGKLSKDEVTDARLHRLFARADADQDGFVTKAELTALFAKDAPKGGGKGGPPGGFPGGPGGFGPPRPGQVLPPFLRDMLGLTADQKTQLDALQKEVDAKLAKILTAEQRKRLGEFPGPGGFGPPGGGPGGPPKGGPGGFRRKVENEDPIPEPTAEAPMPRKVAYSDAAVRAAVEKALPVLWKGAQGHTDRRTCYTCHHHAVPLLAFVTAKARGFKVSDADLAAHAEFLTGWVADQRENLASGRGPGPFPTGGGVDTTSYVLFALEAAGKKPDAATAAVAEYTLNWGRGRDHWWTPAGRHPTEGSDFTTTALAVRGLRRYIPAEHKDKAEKRIAGARTWLTKTKAKDTEDRVFRLLGLTAADAPAEDVQGAVRELVKTQRDDGGWAQTDDRSSDAYATGSALYALHAGGVAADDPVYRRGLAYLLGAQLDDGSWLVRTRSPQVQSYFETGFPHGKDQFISCAATGWAATALALACPPK